MTNFLKTLFTVLTVTAIFGICYWIQDVAEIHPGLLITLLSGIAAVAATCFWLIWNWDKVQDWW